MTSRAKPSPRPLRLRGYARPKPPAQIFSQAHEKSEIEMLGMAAHLLKGIVEYGFARHERSFKVVPVRGSSVELLGIINERLKQGKLSDGANSHLMVEAAMAEAAQKGLVCIIESRLPRDGGRNGRLAQSVFISLVCNGYSVKQDDGSLTSYSIEVLEMGTFMGFLRAKARCGCFTEPQKLNAELRPVIDEAVEKGILRLRKLFSTPKSSVA